MIVLEWPKQKPLVKGDYVVLKCRTVPGDASRQIYDLPIPYFRMGAAEEFLKWKRNVEKDMAGYGATTGPAKYSFTRRLLEGDALPAFELKASQFETETVPNYKKTMEALNRCRVYMKVIFISDITDISGMRVDEYAFDVRNTRPSILK